MSLGYAARLADRDDLGGSLGDPELFDAASQVEASVDKLASWVITFTSNRLV
jgi:hypothetical protein